MNIKKSVDVSERQGNTDWEKGKTQVDLALIRLGFGQPAPDLFAEHNIKEGTL